MNKRALVIAAVLMILTLACNSLIKPTPTLGPPTQPAILHFENDVVSFDYPEGMEVNSAGNPTFKSYPDIELGGELIVGLGDPRFAAFDEYFRSIRIIRQTMPPDSNLEAIMLETYRAAEPHFPQDRGVLDATGVITVDGLDAFQKTYRVYSGEPAYELRDVWIPRGDDLFIVAIWTEYTNPDDFAAFEAGGDLLLRSLGIKQ
jgi:hypothetical protein